MSKADKLMPSSLRPGATNNNDASRLSTASTGDNPRFSGIGAGFMNGDMSDDSDSDSDDDLPPRKAAPAVPPAINQKHAALADLAAAATPPAAPAPAPVPASAPVPPQPSIAPRNLTASPAPAQQRTVNVPVVSPRPVLAAGAAAAIPRALNLTRSPAPPQPSPLSGLANGPAAPGAPAPASPALRAAPAPSRPMQTYPNEKRGFLEPASPATDIQPPAPPYIPLEREKMSGEKSSLSPLAGMNGRSPAFPIAVPLPGSPALGDQAPMMADHGSSPSIPINTPYPLMSPHGPIVPAFATSKSPRASVMIKQSEPIIRGTGEDRILPKRGDRGDDFWRRFSIVAKEERAKKSSNWLSKTMTGSKTLNKTFLILSILLLIGIVGGIFAGWYISHNNPGHSRPVAVGGGANYADTTASSASKTVAGAVGGATDSAVHPTYTLKGRAEPTVTGLSGPEATNINNHHRRQQFRRSLSRLD